MNTAGPFYNHRENAARRADADSLGGGSLVYTLQSLLYICSSGDVVFRSNACVCVCVDIPFISSFSTEETGWRSVNDFPNNFVTYSACNLSPSNFKMTRGFLGSDF